MTFVDVRFPKQYGYGTVGGPGFRTEVVETTNMREKRNRVWTGSRRPYDLTITARTQEQAQEIMAFHAAMGGREKSFRFWDPLDYKLEDEQIGVGTGAQLTFQATKTYRSGSASHTRIIDKLIAGVEVRVNGVPKTPVTDYTVSLNTGVITFLVAPASAAVVSLTGQFDVCVRFVEDELRWIAIDSNGPPPDQYLWRPESLNLIEVIGE